MAVASCIDGQLRRYTAVLVVAGGYPTRMFSVNSFFLIPVYRVSGGSLVSYSSQATKYAALGSYMYGIVVTASGQTWQY